MTGKIHGILFVDTSPYFGEAPRNLFTLVNHLDKSRYQPFVLSSDISETGLFAQLKRNKDIPTRIVKLREQSHRARSILNLFVDLSRFKQSLLKLLDDFDISVVCANTSYAGLLTALTLPKKVPFVFCLREHHARSPTTGHIIRRSYKTLAISDFVADRCRDGLSAGVAKKLTTVYDGFSFETEEILRKKFSYRDIYLHNCDHTLIACIADMLPWKRHALFLEAFALAWRKNPALFGLIIGKAFDREDYAYIDSLEDQARKLGILGNIAIMEYATNYMPILDECKAAVSVAENEPFGSSIVQALAIGKPAVITKGNALEEITRGCRTVKVVSDEPAKIADGILGAIVGGKRKKSDSDRAKIIERYAIESQVGDFCRLVDEAISS